MKERIKLTFRALKYRNYRLFLFGQGFSVIGTWMQKVALGWLIYKLTGSALLLGVVGFTSNIPIIFTPLAGVIIDRYSKMRILLITQTLAMLQATVLAALVLFGQIQVWQIISLSLLLGVINAFDVPGRQSLYIQLVNKKEDLPNAIAINSAVFHSSRFIGPSLAGIIIASYGEGICFLVNAISYLAVLASLIRMDVKEVRVESETSKSFAQELKEGFQYVASRPPLRSILMLVGAVSIFGWSYNILLPVFAKDIFGGDATTFGFLTSAVAVGSIIGALFAASRKHLDGIGMRSVIFTGVFGLALILFALSKYFWLSIFFLALAGLGTMLHNTSANSFFQSKIDGEKRGRAMSFYALAHQGLMPLGNLFLGVMASAWGAEAAFMVSGLFCIITAVFFGIKMKSSLQ